ncbi:SEC-C metal-binding domain-containing protein [Herpetosiphon gulosus]|uniref:SEC-C motif-containing protein n=1 Tax=Herpetosiphon gulosus TaxID=1973496 RepID=A0ABP9X8W4_9CHLR
MGNKKHRNNKSIGRNDPCWCGSHQKYKYCHLRREAQVAPTTHEMVKHIKRAQAQKYCLHPRASVGECEGGIINAHTVQKNGGLSKIAENGHVYALDTDFLNLRKTNGRLQMKLMGIRVASTFTGFCGKHDQQIFASFEQGGFIASDRHAFLLGYRALCEEIFAKNVARDTATVQRIMQLFFCKFPRVPWRIVG